MKSNKLGVAAASAVLSISIPVLPSAASGAEPSGRAEEIIVTAARVEQPVSEVIGSVSVITREDIQRRVTQSMQDLLSGETGLDVVNTGGLGKLSNVFLRGADAEQVLVLVDGVRIGSATSGTTVFEFLPVEEIERIEIVRGPRSSLYGADAMGGVIQIFTRRADGVSFKAGVGSHETRQANGSFGATGENAWVSLSGGRQQSEGFNSCRGAPFPPGGGCFTYEPDADGYESTSGSARAGYRWGDRAEVEASALYARGVTEFDGSFSNETDFTQRVVTLRSSVRATDRWRLHVTGGEARDDRKDSYDDPYSASGASPAGRYSTVRRNASLQSDVTLTPVQLFTFGADYVDDRIASSTGYTTTSRDNVGLFAQWQARLGAHNLLLSARHDDNEQFGGYDTGSVGWRWTLAPQLTVTAAWGSAFGAPTFNDLYYPGFSNPDLDPERSKSYELGVNGVAGALRWSAAVYESRIDDLIVYDASIWAPNNLHEARIRGVELEAGVDVRSWSFTLGYSGLDPRNRTAGDYYDAVLPRRSRHSGRLGVARSFGPLDARITLTAAGPRYDDVANQNRLGGYALLDLVFDYALNERWTLQARVANALDRDYQTVRLFNQDGRTFLASVRYQPR